MIAILEKMFGKKNTPEQNTTLTQQQLQLAIAALLVEVAVSDQNFDDSEMGQLKEVLGSHCQLNESEALELITDAQQASKDSASLYEFTHQINAHCSHEEKFSVIEGLWKIAYADNVVDKYESHIIRRIADLIHVSHADYIRAKQQARLD